MDGKTAAMGILRGGVILPFDNFLFLSLGIFTSAGVTSLSGLGLGILSHSVHIRAPPRPALLVSIIYFLFFYTFFTFIYSLFLCMSSFNGRISRNSAYDSRFIHFSEDTLRVSPLLNQEDYVAAAG